MRHVKAPLSELPASGSIPTYPPLAQDDRPIPLGAAFLEAYRALAENLLEADPDADAPPRGSAILDRP